MTSTMWKPMLTTPISERDHLLGDINAPVSLVEYGDYECPFCGEAKVTLDELLPRMTEWGVFAYRHFPITTLHAHAELAAEAAEAAGAQGKFWQMHDMLFANQDRLRPKNLMEYADALGLDRSRFDRDLEGHANHERIEQDFMSGVRSGVNGTPTFFINGMRYDGPRDVDSMLTAMQESLVFR